jgi:hypothetical protein
MKLLYRFVWVTLLATAGISMAHSTPATAKAACPDAEPAPRSTAWFSDVAGTWDNASLAKPGGRPGTWDDIALNCLPESCCCPIPRN